MPDLKVRVYKKGKAQPDTTITIPGSVLRIARNLIPRQAADALQEKGVDLEEIIKLSANPDVSGTIIEIEDHKKGQKTVISLEQHR